MALWSELTWIDLVVLAVVGLSAAISLMRGLVAEITSLAIWVVAIVAASRLAGVAADLMPRSLPAPLQQSAAFLAVLILVLVLGKILTIALRQAVKAAGLGMVDRLLGTIFGLARGGLMVVVLAILGAMTSLPSQPAWKKAKTREALELGIRTAAPWLPETMEEKVRMPKQSSANPDAARLTACGMTLSVQGAWSCVA